jgi:hypothetical protein
VGREELTMKKTLTRREFVGTAAAVVVGAPAILRGRNLNSKLDIAFIAAGGRALASLGELTIEPNRPAKPGEADPTAPAAPHPDENVAVLCDTDDLALDAACERFP